MNWYSAQREIDQRRTEAMDWARSARLARRTRDEARPDGAVQNAPIPGTRRQLGAS
ncbi:MAG: hypothetical protein WBU92_08745 [Candidatus Dormiibacterota bacterium]